MMPEAFKIFYPPIRLMDKVIVTGATGFIGRHLVPRLLEEEYEVHTVERKSSSAFGANRHLARHFLDVNDYKNIGALVKRVDPQYAINLAALASIGKSIENPIDASNVTYLAAVNLAEACRRNTSNFKQFITAGSQEEYGTTLTDRSQKLTEETPLDPNNPYSIFKINVETYLSYLRRAYRFPSTVLRIFITYGREDDAPFFIDKTLSQMSEGRPVEITNSDAVRDWIYVDDTVEGFMKALGNSKAIGQAFNLCCGEGHTVREASELIAELTKSRSKVVYGHAKRNQLEPQILVGDNAKARKMLGWRPRYDLRAGLIKTIKKRGLMR